MSRTGSESALHPTRGSTDARGAGGLAWEHARHLAQTRLRATRSAVRRYRVRQVLAGLVVIVIAWSTAAISWQVRTEQPVVAGVVLLAGGTMVTFGARRVLTQTRRLRRATSAMRWIGEVARSPWNDVEAALLPAATGQGDIDYWAVSALTHRCTAHALEQLRGGQTWWHDLQLHGDPSLILDHVSVGRSGIVVVHDVVLATTDTLMVDAVFGLSYRGWQLGTPGAEHVLARPMRAASTIARAAGLDLTHVTSIAVVANASLTDAWGARTCVRAAPAPRWRRRGGLLHPGAAAAARLTQTQLHADLPPWLLWRSTDQSPQHCLALSTNVLGARLVGAGIGDASIDPTGRTTMVDHEDGADSGPMTPLVRLWAGARAIQHAVATIACRPDMDADPRFLTAAMYCGEAADELQRAHPDIGRRADIPDMAADLTDLSTAAATEWLLGVIADTIAGFDIDLPDLPAMDVLVAAAAGNALALAYHAISGRLP